MSYIGGPSLQSQSLLSNLQNQTAQCQSMSNNLREQLLEEIQQKNELIFNIHQIIQNTQSYEGFEIIMTSDSKLDLIDKRVQAYLVQKQKIEKSDCQISKTDTGTCQVKNDKKIQTLFQQRDETYKKMQTIFEQSIIDSGQLNINPLFLRQKSKEQQNEGFQIEYTIDNLNPPIDDDQAQNNSQNFNTYQNQNNPQLTLPLEVAHTQINNQNRCLLLENLTKIYELFLNWQLIQINIELATTDLYLQLCDNKNAQNITELNLKYNHIKNIFKENQQK